MNTPSRTSPGRRITGDAAWRATADAHPTLLPVRFLLELNARLDAPRASRATAGRTLALGDGAFEGPRLLGRVEPSSAWAMPAASDNAARGKVSLELSLALRTADGAALHLQCHGVLLDGDYLQLGSRFRTDADAYRWVQDVVGFGVGRLSQDGALACRFYAID